MSICLECHEEIIWAKDLLTSRPRPIDPTPHDDDSGKIAARYVDERSLRRMIPFWECYSISQLRPLREGFRTYTAHHATCPDHFLHPSRQPVKPQEETLF